MLHTETVDAKTLALIKDIMKKDYFNDFYLVGGTALSLQIGHRTSTDIDLFCHQKFDKESLCNRVEFDYKDFQYKINFFGIFGYINEVKTDIVFHPYPNLYPLLEIDGIRMVHKKEIASMKISAITKRAKKRDFVDLFLLLKEYSLVEILDDYIKKFGKEGEAYVLRSLMYFDEADDDVVPKCFFEMDWQKIKDTITAEVRKL
jgi:predicted nucleotidyltransferase component of viral defense system